MNTKNRYRISRRNFIKVSAAGAAGISMLPMESVALDRLPAPMKRKLGNLGFEVTTLGLGGQASIQWTPDDVDPVSIILKAFQMGINYYDTSNLYADSQLNYHKAFKKLNLIPGEPDYDESLRRSVWLTSKTAMRWGNPGGPDRDRVRNRSNGSEVQCAVDDVKRSLTQIFGDGSGWYPEGAYLDMVLIHTLSTAEEVDVLYEGLETPLDSNGNFGALIALRDLRDGTNHTGMNPEQRKLIKHIGFSGHNNPPVMIDIIQRDEWGILDGLLVSINANDRQMFNMQHNVIPVAEAKGMGIIGMKVFADAAMYHKEARWSNKPEDVYRKVGKPGLPSKPLIEYSLTTPGVHTLIIGIGQIDDDPMKCQLVQNYYASQIEPNGLAHEERLKIEQMAATAKEGKTNYFQLGKEQFTGGPRLVKKIEKNEKQLVTWHTAFAADEPISHYEVVIDGRMAGRVDHHPQISQKKPFTFETTEKGKEIIVAAIDASGNRMETKLA